MTDELALVHDYMNRLDVQDLPRARSLLREAIEAEPAVIGRANGSVPRGPRAGRMARWVVGVAATSAVCAVLIFQVVPSTTPATPTAAAAQISHLADTVHPAPSLRAGQWSRYLMQGVLSADISTVDHTPTPNAKASIPIDIEVWSNSTGAACTSERLGTASFASATNAQAWHTTGLIDTPAHQPVTACASTTETGDPALATIDVTQITRNPARLAAQLQGGTTGIASIDRVATGDSGPIAGFVRLTDLLVGPVSGPWPGFGREMIRTLSLLPDVIALGRTTSHSGRSGMAFSLPQRVTLDPRTGAVISKWSGPTVVLNGRTGALLEARNFDIPVLHSAAQDFVGPSAPWNADEVGYAISDEWIDPVAPPAVVATGALPAWISTFEGLRRR